MQNRDVTAAQRELNMSTLLEENNLTAAIKSMKKLSILKPDDFLIQFTLGKFYARDGNANAAEIQAAIVNRLDTVENKMSGNLIYSYIVFYQV